MLKVDFYNIIRGTYNINIINYQENVSVRVSVKDLPSNYLKDDRIQNMYIPNYLCIFYPVFILYQVFIVSLKFQTNYLYYILCNNIFE